MSLLFPAHLISDRLRADLLWHPEAAQAIEQGLHWWRWIAGVLGLSLMARAWTWNRLWGREQHDRPNSDDQQAQIHRNSTSCAMTIVCLVSFGVLAAYAQRFPSYDELVSVHRYASESVLEIVGYHNSANNQVLNTLAIKLSQIIYALPPISWRWASLLSGVGVVLALWLLLKRILPAIPATSIAVAAALMLQHVRYATEARGYMLGAIFYFLFLLAILSRHRFTSCRPFLLAAVMASLAALAQFLYVAFIALSFIGLLLAEATDARERALRLRRALWGGCAIAFAVAVCISHLMPSFLFLTLPNAGTARGVREADLTQLMSLSIPGLPPWMAGCAVIGVLLGFLSIVRLNRPLGLVLCVPWTCIVLIVLMTDYPRDARFAYPIAYLTIIGLAGLVAQVAALARPRRLLLILGCAILAIGLIVANAMRYSALHRDLYGLAQASQEVQALVAERGSLKIGALGETAHLLSPLHPEVRPLSSVKEAEELRKSAEGALLISYDLLRPEDETIRSAVLQWHRKMPPTARFVGVERGRRAIVLFHWRGLLDSPAK